MGKDYNAEAKKIHVLIQRYKKSDGNLLLEVACGTGLHISHLKQNYKIEGLDLDNEMLKMARRNYPGIRFHQGDMVDFDLGRQFDAITCLFSSIGYVKTKARLNKAIKTMTRHLKPGGVLLIEPWFSREQWSVGRVGLLTVEKPEYKVVRMSRGATKGKLSILEFEYLIGTAKGIEHSKETHELGLFAHEDHLSAFRAAGLIVKHDRKGLDGRGLYIGLKPLN